MFEKLTINTQELCPSHYTETSKLICTANQFIGFHMKTMTSEILIYPTHSLRIFISHSQHAFAHWI